MKRIAPYLLVYLLLVSCNNDLDVTFEYKPTTFVYGILDKRDSLHLLRINRSFLAKGSALDFINESDSLNHYNLDITIEFSNLQGSKLVYPEAIIFKPKDSGIFYSEPNVLYAFNDNIKSFTRAHIRIILPEYADTVSASTELVVPGKLLLPGLWTLSDQVSFYGGGYKMLWRTGSGYYNELTLTFHYSNHIGREKFKAEFSHIIEYNFTPDNERDFTLPLKDFLSMVKSGIPVSQTVEYRVFDSIDLHLDSAEKFLFEYSRIHAYDPPEFALINFTNITNGSGIFSSKARSSVTGLKLDIQAMDSLVNGPITRMLNFVHY